MNRKQGIAYTYSITRTASGQKYIGVTIKPEVRWWTHRWLAGKSSQFIHKAIAKYGHSAFVFEVLACSRTWHEAASVEQALIEQFKTHVSNGGYNLTLGGEGPNGRKCSAETRAKISKANKGRGHAIPMAQRDVHRQRTADMYLAHPELRLKLGRLATAARIRNGNNGEGRKNSPETISKMRESARRRWANTGVETRKNHMEKPTKASVLRRGGKTGQFLPSQVGA